jgi:hypothetical protein
VKLISCLGRTWTVAGGILSAFVLSAAVVHSAFALAGEEKEFRKLFDGETLDGWRGDPTLWSVQGGAITGTSLAGTPKNTFLIHKENFRNFELHFKYRFLTQKGNSGLQYRSQVVSEEDFSVTGYQANVVTTDARERFAMLWDEEARGLLAYLGERVHVTRDPDGLKREVIGMVNDPAQILKATRPFPAWNDYVIIAYENHILNAVNGLLATDVVDDDVEGRDMEGVLALQLHAGRSMGVQFKEIEIRELEEEPNISGRFISSATSGAAPSPSKVASSADALDGEAIYIQRCAMCHNSGQKDIPPKETIAAYPHDSVVSSLTNGSMVDQAFGLTDSEISAVASYLMQTRTSDEGQGSSDQPSH